MKRLLAIALLSLSLLVFVFPAAADSDSPGLPVNTITVTGMGVAYGAPDIATLEIGVETANPDVVKAFNDTNTKIDNIIAALVAAGVAREDIRTINLSIFQDYNPYYSGGAFPRMPMEPGMEGEPVQNYRVSNMIRASIRDIDKVAEVINAAVSAGANQIYGLIFGLSDMTPLESDARRDAMADARTRAAALAELADVELGQVLVINEGFGSNFLPYSGVMASFEQSMGMGGGAVIEPGQLSVTVQIQVTFAINN